MKSTIFNQPLLTKVLAFALVLFACFTLSNCSKTSNTLPSSDEPTASILELANLHPERLFINAESGVTGRYIVLFKDDFLRPAVLDEQINSARPTGISDRNASRYQQAEIAMNDFFTESNITHQQVHDTYAHLISGFTATLTDAQVKRLLSDPRIESIEQDMLLKVDDVVESVVKSGNTPDAQTTPCGITRHGGAGNGSTSTKWIWIVDSGIQSSHPDLNVVTNTIYAKSFVGGTFQDCQGHGTHCAGIAAAKNNTIGTIGMSAGAPVVPVKIMDGCGSSYYNSTLLSALNHVAAYDESGDVVNLSLGGYYGAGCSTGSPLRVAIQNLGNSGTWVVIAAGNDSANAANYQPACINGTRILTMANMTCSNTWNSSSNYNASSTSGPIDWIAVGSSVYSTYLNSGYAYLTGTSMSTPHVAGIVHWRQSNPLQNGSVVRSGISYKVASRI